MQDENYTEGFGAKALTFAMIAGAALLFLEATWSPTLQGGTAAKTATVETVPVTPTAQIGRMARN